eukprot:318313_1
MSALQELNLLLSLINNSNKNNNNEELTNIPPDSLSNLHSFIIEEDLIQCDDFVTFKGNFGDINKPSILKIRPSKPKASELKQFINKMKLISCNKYGKGFGFYKAKCITTKSFNVDVIYPWIESDNDQKETEENKKQRLKAQQKVFDKFYQRNLPKKSYIIRETPEMYKNITLPYIQSIPTNDIQWVYDILDEKREANGIIAVDYDVEYGFVSVPDSKWKSHPKVDTISKSEWKLNESISTSLYLLCIVRNKEIKSLRDLKGKHIKLLQNLLNKTIKAIKNIYNVNKNELRIYVHYPPQYWHFHIHFTCLAVDYGINIGKSIFLEDIIQNLKMDPNYYQKTNISCLVFKGNSLADKLLQ